MNEIVNAYVAKSFIINQLHNIRFISLACLQKAGY